MKIDFTQMHTGEFESLSKFRDLHPSADIVMIDDKEVFGFCEGCDKPIFYDDFYYEYKDGPITCEECTPDEFK